MQFDFTKLSARFFFYFVPVLPFLFSFSLFQFNISKNSQTHQQIFLIFKMLKQQQTVLYAFSENIAAKNQEIVDLLYLTVINVRLRGEQQLQYDFFAADFSRNLEWLLLQCLC